MPMKDDGLIMVFRLVSERVDGIQDAANIVLGRQLGRHVVPYFSYIRLRVDEPRSHAVDLFTQEGDFFPQFGLGRKFGPQIRP